MKQGDLVKFRGMTCMVIWVDDITTDIAVEIVGGTVAETTQEDVTLIKGGNKDV